MPPRLSSVPSSRFVAPRDFVCGGTAPLDFDGHGTHVSGTIGQSTNDGVGTAGVAFNVKIMPVKVLASIWDVAFGCADSDGGSDDDVARGIRYAVDNGARILNLSLGSDGPAGSAPVVEDAIRYAVGKGAFVAVAAGNSFEDGNPMQVLAEIASRVDGAVSVAAVDPQKKHAFYSSSGVVRRARRAGRIDPGLRRGRRRLAADVRSELHGHVSSAAGPVRRPALRRVRLRAVPGHVDGDAARVRRGGDADAAGHHRSGRDRNGARDDSRPTWAIPGRDPLYGFGLIEARSALRGLGIAR